MNSVELPESRGAIDRVVYTVLNVLVSIKRGEPGEEEEEEVKVRSG